MGDVTDMKTVCLAVFVFFFLLVPVSGMDLPVPLTFDKMPVAGPLVTNTGEPAFPDTELQAWSGEGEFLGNISGGIFSSEAGGAPTLVRQKLFGGSEDEIGYGQRLWKLSDGGYLLAASYTKSNNGDVSGNHGGKDIWVAKLRSNWTIAWQRSLGGSGDESANSFALSPNNKTFLIFGSTTSNDGDVKGNHGGTDVWVVNMSLANGNIISQRCYGGSGEESDFSLFELYKPDSGWMLLATSTSNNGDMTGNHGGRDVCIVKFFPNFSIDWRRCYGGSGADIRGSSFYRESENSNVTYTVMAFSESNNGDVSGNHGGFDVWLFRIAPNGTILRKTTLGGSKNDNTTGTGGTFQRGWVRDQYYYVGNTFSNDGDVSGNHGGSDIWYVRLNELLVPEAQHCFGGSGNDEYWSFSSHRDQGFGLIGYVRSNDGDIAGYHGGTDIWMAEVMKNMTIRWQKSLGGSGDESGRWMAYSDDISSGYFLISTSSRDGDLIQNRGGIDTWFLRLVNGTIDWQRFFGGINDDIGASIIQSDDGSATYISGMTNSSDGNVTGNHGKNDLWLLQLSGFIMPDFSATPSSGYPPLRVNFYDSTRGAVNRSWDLGDGNTSTEKSFTHTYYETGEYPVRLTVSSNYTSGVRNGTISVKPVPRSPPVLWQRVVGFTNTTDDFSWATSIQETTSGGFIVSGTSGVLNLTTYPWIDPDFLIFKLTGTGTPEWKKTLGGDGDDESTSVRQTADGGYIVAGNSNSTSGDVVGNHGGYDAWVVKLGSTGTVQWKKSLGGSEDDSALSIRQTRDGGYILAGSTNSSNGDVTGKHAGTDFWLVKLTSSGVIQWQKCLGGSGNETASSAEETADGGYIVAGTSDSNDGDVSGNHGHSDFWIVKTDTIGNIQWQKSYGGYDEDGASSIVQTNDGGYAAAGNTGSYGGDISGQHGWTDYWIIKLDNSGILQWDLPLGGTDADAAAQIRQTRDNGYIVAGYSGSSNGDVYGAHGDKDYWVVKISEFGELEWQKPLGGSNVDAAFAVAATSDGGSVVAGISCSNEIIKESSAKSWIVRLANSVSEVPVADFRMNVSSGSSPLAVQFTDLSTGNMSSWYWQFGNGKTSTARNPATIYGVTKTTTFTINLTVSNGTLSSKKSRTITVSPAPVFRVVVPNGGNIWMQGSLQTIRWNYTGSPGSTVKIDLLKGTTVNRVISASAATGSGGMGNFSWTVPFNQTIGADYKIRITSTMNGAWGDRSDANFTIRAGAPITIAMPSGGQNWKQGSLQTIRWSYTGNPGPKVKLELLRGKVLTRVINASTSAGAAGSGSYSWKVPFNQAVGADYRIRINSTSKLGYSNMSGANFTISAGAPITVTVPNGGQSWTRGSTRLITWSYTGNPGPTVRIELLKGTGVNRVINSSTSAGSLGSGSYSWQIAADQTPGTDYRIRINSTVNPALTDTSNANFIIS